MLISSRTNIFILLICRKKKWLIDVHCISWRGYFSEYSLLTALITTLARNGNIPVTLRKKRIRYGWHEGYHNCLDKHPRQNFIVVHFIFFVKIQVIRKISPDEMRKSNDIPENNLHKTWFDTRCYNPLHICNVHKQLHSIPRQAGFENRTN